jgi:S-adenosylmethionine-diacylglycerol 3-amino-3-carboxypropyl transferase
MNTAMAVEPGAFGALGQWKDRLFQSVFSRTFTFTLLLEDAEVDDRYFEVDERSSVLSISGAGCSVTGMLARRPRRIDVVDANRHHLAVTALKMAAARGLASYEAFYQLFGHGAHPAADRVIAGLLPSLPPWLQRYWAERGGLFASSFYHHGLMGQLFAALRAQAGTSRGWMTRLMREPVEARRAEVSARFEPVLRSAPVATLMRSPIFLLANGINYVQKERNLRADHTRDVIDVIVAYLRRIAATDLERNWIAWNATVGHFNHDLPDAVPPYLRRAHHERSVGAPTDVRFHCDDIFAVMAGAGRGAWTHVNLCDAIDWMPPAVQRRLLEEAARTTGEGGVVLYRSVEDRCLAADLGLAHRLRRIEPASTEASALDRTSLYRRVNFYRVVQ